MIIREVLKEDKEKILDFKREFEENNEMLHGGSKLCRMNFEEFFESLSLSKNKETVPNGWVPSSSYIAVVDDRIVGILNLRYELNENLLNIGGHIGYSIRKSERRNGYAKEMLRLSLDKARELGLEKVLITCNVDNLGSEKTILANGGVFENIYKDEEENVKRFWINL